MYCLFDVAFNGVPKTQSAAAAMLTIEFASAWDLRVQFYPLSILITMATLPFTYLVTKLIRSDILV